MLISEQSMHKAVMDWVRLHALFKHLVLHIPNEGRRTLRYGKLLKDLGMRRGASDLFIASAKHGFHGAFIELKSAKGVLSPAQQSFLNDMHEQGYYTDVCYSIEETISRIKWYFSLVN